MFKFFKKYQKIIIFFSILIVGLFLGFGFLGNWLLTRGSLQKFPSLNSADRLLILAPHMDDEVIGSGGLIQEGLRVGGKVKVVYFTTGESEETVVARHDKSFKFDPNEFIALGERRMNEARQATKVLGLSEKDLIFLGYAERGLYPMLSKFYGEETAFPSPWTKFSFNPFSQTYRTGQNYNGSNLVKDLKEIISDFKPTLVITPHPRDKHQDHRAVYLFLEKVLSDESWHPHVFSYLVHYHFFPSEKRLKMNQFLFPPKKLFSQAGWYSFDLTEEQENKKLAAVNQNVSQRELRPFYDLLQSFVKRNEIFEKLD